VALAPGTGKAIAFGLFSPFLFRRPGESRGPGATSTLLQPLDPGFRRDDEEENEVKPAGAEEGKL
jgi:hypothetical protein